MFHILQEKMERYLDFLSFLLCPCKEDMHFGTRYFSEYDRWDFFKERYADERDQIGYNLIDRKEKLTHHEGHIIDILSSGIKSINETMVDKWVNDVEHGLLHGFFVGFIAFLYKYNCNIPKSAYANCHRIGIHDDTRLMASCLLHDFARFGNHSDHDKALEQYFNLLPEETYRHSDPWNEDEKLPLIAGDRMELKRFEDHTKWCDLTILKQYFDDNELVEYFYSRIRPAIEAIYQDRNTIWIRHGIDVPPTYLSCDLTSDTYYPMRHWHKTGYPESENYWSVEVGKPPFLGCMLHTHKYAPWGIFPLNECKNRNVHVRKVWSRDHFGACGNISLKDWVFILPTMRYDTMHPVHHAVLKCCKGYVSVEIINKTLTILDHFVTIMKVAACNRKSDIRLV
jgi:hypothetical protein